MGRLKNKIIMCKQSCKYGFIYTNQQEYFRKLYHERKKARLKSSYEDDIKTKPKPKSREIIKKSDEPIKLYFD